MSARWPDFFIVGAPRSGTSFLWEALRQHPRVYMPQKKEPLYFCTDLNTGTAADQREFLSERTYLNLFRAAPEDALVGEACVYNLFSEVAAERIHSARPDARIIICLRAPVDQLISFHAIRVGEGQEDLPLEEALAAEPDRRHGRRLPATAVLVPAYQYRSMASYSAQIDRYLNQFPREQLLIQLYDDLVADPQGWLASVASFLELPPGEFVNPGVVNARWQPRSGVLTRLTRSMWLITAAKRVVPRRLHDDARHLALRVSRLNRRPAGPPRADVALRDRLKAELRPDVERLERLIGRDVSARWK